MSKTYVVFSSTNQKCTFFLWLANAFQIMHVAFESVTRRDVKDIKVHHSMHNRTNKEVISNEQK